MLVSAALLPVNLPVCVPTFCGAVSPVAKVVGRCPCVCLSHDLFLLSILPVLFCSPEMTILSSLLFVYDLQTSVVAVA